MGSTKKKRGDQSGARKIIRSALISVSGGAEGGGTKYRTRQSPIASTWLANMCDHHTAEMWQSFRRSIVSELYRKPQRQPGVLRRRSLSPARASVGRKGLPAWSRVKSWTRA